MRKEKNTIKLKVEKKLKKKKMIKKILIILICITFTGCATIGEKIPKRQACTGDETNKTIAEVLCKK